MVLRSGFKRASPTQNRGLVANPQSHLGASGSRTFRPSQTQTIFSRHSGRQNVSSALSSLPSLNGISKHYDAPTTKSTLLHSAENPGSDRSDLSSSCEAESSHPFNHVQTPFSSMVSNIIGNTHGEIFSDVEG